ncbi:hypothetical protein [Rhodococcus erythropolis]|uniref:hypothetical protein n=1 Tax=Rhodococcus erythropolis TaxID=1833 RepID=UPI000A74BE08|nr:hypothetical protein [Rhodococcus erythropolis]
MTVRSSVEPLVDNNWRMFATCKTVDPAVFYSPGEERGRNSGCTGEFREAGVLPLPGHSGLPDLCTRDR